MQRRRAMSLLEVTIVILILGLLSAVAAPRFNATFRAMKLQAATQQLVAHLRYVRRVAINEGRTASMQFDTALATYSCDSVDAPQLIGAKLFVDLGTDFDGDLSLKADFDSSDLLSFNFEGVPFVGDVPMVNGQVVLVAGDSRYEIEIAPGTGQVAAERLASSNNSFVSALAAIGHPLGASK